MSFSSCQMNIEDLRTQTDTQNSKEGSWNIPCFLNSSFLSSHLMHLELDYILQWYFLRTFPAIGGKKATVYCHCLCMCKSVFRRNLFNFVICCWIFYLPLYFKLHGDLVYVKWKPLTKALNIYLSKAPSWLRKSNF